MSRDRENRAQQSITSSHESRSRRSYITLFLLARYPVCALSLTGLFLIWIQCSASADAFDAKSDLFLQRRLASQPIPQFTAIILKVTGEITPVQEQQVKRLGGTIYRHLPLIHSIAVRVPTWRLRVLAAQPFVARLSEDVCVKTDDEFTVDSSGADVAYQQDALTGQGITAAVVDSGIYLHSDLKDPVTLASRIKVSINFVPHTTSTKDGYGHGTHVAGILAGNGAASTGSSYYRTFYGIARKVKLVNVRVLDATGSGAVSTAIAGIQWVVTNKVKYNIRVLNLSLGHPVGENYTTDPLCQAVEQAWKAGIVVVCAAGNDGRLNPVALPGFDNEGYGTAYGTIEAPGNDPYVITVGSMKSYDGTRIDDRIATYSSRGPSRLDMVIKPDIVAPGNRVISLRCPGSTLDVTEGVTHIVPPGAYMVNPPPLASSAYFEMSGTSMAAPVVSGAAALLLQAKPKLTPDEVKARLMISADFWSFPDGTPDVCTFGTGYLYIPSALACPASPKRYALSPYLTQDARGNVTFNFDALVWGTQVIWGLQTTWGTQALWTDNSIYSESTVSALPVLQNEE